MKLHQISSIGSFMEVQTSTVACSFMEGQTCLLSLSAPQNQSLSSTEGSYSTIPAVFHLTLYRSAHKIHYYEGIRRLHQAQFFSAVQCLTDVTKSSFMLLFSA